MKRQLARHWILIPAFLAGLLISGCDSRGPTKSEPKENPISAIEFAALKYAMTSHAASGEEREEYSYYVIERSSYIERLANFSPPIAIDDGARFGRVYGVYKELATGKNAKLWTIDSHTIDKDVAEVWISWYSASLAGGALAVTVKRIDGEWIATAIKDGPVS